MNRQPKRLLTKSRKYTRPSSSGSSKAGDNDGWITAYPKLKQTKYTDDESGDSTDEDLRLSQLKADKEKSSSPKKLIDNKKSWNDGCSSSDSESSSSDSDSSDSASESSDDNSVEEFRKCNNNKKAETQSRQPKKKESKVKTKTLSRSSLNKVRNAGVREHTTPYNAPRRDIAKLGKRGRCTLSIIHSLILSTTTNSLLSLFPF